MIPRLPRTSVVPTIYKKGITRMHNDRKGSNWRKWDLHIHTPAFLQHNYTGGMEKSWEEFIADIERLPEHFKVIGINDYIFIDGYRRVREYQSVIKRSRSLRLRSTNWSTDRARKRSIFSTHICHLPRFTPRLLTIMSTRMSLTPKSSVAGRKSMRWLLLKLIPRFSKDFVS
jgi:hypothetical protein